MKKFKNYNWDWDNIPVGSMFSGRIQGVPVEGRIQKDIKGGYIYLCQNKKPGMGHKDQLGYSHSWCVGRGMVSNLEVDEVEIYYIWLPTKKWLRDRLKQKKIPAHIGGHPIYTITADFLEIGCQEISFETVSRIHQEMIKQRKEIGI